MPAMSSWVPWALLLAVFAALTAKATLGVVRRGNRRSRSVDPAIHHTAHAVVTPAFTR